MVDTDCLWLGICFILCAFSLMFFGYVGGGDTYMIFVFLSAIVCHFKKWPRWYYVCDKRHAIDINYYEVRR